MSDPFDLPFQPGDIPVVANVQPQVFDPLYTHDPTTPFDPIDTVRSMIVTPMLTPLDPAIPVDISLGSLDLSQPDELTTIVTFALDNELPAPAADTLHTLFARTMTFYTETKALSPQEVFVNQTASKLNLPLPTKDTLYTAATDIIPTCKRFLSKLVTWDHVFANMALFARPRALGFGVRSHQAMKALFDHILDYAKAQGAPTTVIQDLCTTLQSSKVEDLTQSWTIRASDEDGAQPLSLPRVLTAALLDYASTYPDQAHVFPFHLNSLVIPHSIILVNVEAHARAQANDITQEWDAIRRSLQRPYRVHSLKSIAQLTQAARWDQKLHSMNLGFTHDPQHVPEKSANFTPGDNPPTPRELMRTIRRILQYMGTVSRSDNTIVTQHKSFAKPSRRNPDDFNIKGKIHTTRYVPNIHIYVDTSASISRENFNEACMTCIKIAQALNVDVYINSFASDLSQTLKIPTKDRSIAECVRMFNAWETITGGTNFEQVWNFINDSAQRQRELSVMITDFEYYAPQYVTAHPKNLFYIPCSNVNWSTIRNAANQFVSSMQHIDPSIAQRLIM